MNKLLLRTSVPLSIALFRISCAAQNPTPQVPSNVPEPAAVAPSSDIAPTTPADDPPPVASSAAVPLIDSLEALQKRIKVAVAGDTIVLKNGVYTTTGVIAVKQAGTADKPITITAETPGGVEIAGVHGFKISEPAAYVVISGFKFIHAGGKSAIAEGTTHVRFTRNTFLCSGDGAFLTVAGDDAQVDHNEFGPKKSAGAMIAVSGVGNQVARRLWIHHNYFHDFENDGGSGAEMIRFGLLSSHRVSTGAGLVEHNLFVRCRGVSDMISNRSSGNTFRYNTFLDSPTSHLTIRQGNDCVIAGNYFRNTEGVRFYGDRHQIFSNYFEKNYIAVAIGNGDVEFAETPEASANRHDRPNDSVIVFNTFIDNDTAYRMSGGSGGLGATNTTFANNLIVGGAVAAKIDGPHSGATWSGNLLWNNPDPRALPTTGFVSLDPLLVAGPDEIKRPESTSPVHGAALGEFPLVTFDMDGQPRPEKKSVGADELSSAAPLVRMLSPSDVGPAALQPIPQEPVQPQTPPAVDTPDRSEPPAQPVNPPAAEPPPAVENASSAASRPSTP